MARLAPSIEIVDLTGDDEEESLECFHSNGSAVAASAQHQSRQDLKEPSTSLNIGPNKSNAATSSTSQDTASATNNDKNHQTRGLPYTNGYHFLKTPTSNTATGAIKKDPTSSPQKPLFSNAPALRSFMTQSRTTNRPMSENKNTLPTAVGGNVQPTLEELHAEASVRRSVSVVSKAAEAVGDVRTIVQKTGNVKPDQRGPVKDVHSVNDSSKPIVHSVINRQPILSFGSPKSKSPYPGKAQPTNKVNGNESAPSALNVTPNPDLHTREIELLQVIPQKRKKSSPSPSAEALIPPALKDVSGDEPTDTALVTSTTSQVPLSLPPPSNFVEAPQPVLQPLPKSVLPRSDTNTSLASEPRLSLTAPSDAVSRAIAALLSQIEPNTSNHDPHVTSRANVQKVMTPAVCQDENCTDLESPATPLPPADFDRGRFPYQRRRRGARSGPSPMISKGHHNKASDNPLTSKPPGHQNRSYKSITMSQSLVNMPAPPSYAGSTVTAPWKFKNSPRFIARPGTRLNGIFSHKEPLVPDEPENQQSLEIHQDLTTRNEPAKRIARDSEGLKLLPDYLGSPRTNGWHHNGYADVRKLFKSVISDTVRIEKERYKDWPIDLESILHRVTEKADGWASKRFDNFLICLKISPTAIPNSKDVEWLYRQTAQTFFEEACLAKGNAAVQTALPSCSQDDANATSNNLDTPGQMYITTLTDNEDSNFNQPVTRSDSSSTSSAYTSPQAEELDPPFKSHRSNHWTISNRRPTRSAAHTAAYRITSQYQARPIAQDEEARAEEGHAEEAYVEEAHVEETHTKGAHVEETHNKGAHAPAVVHPKRLCSYCNCMISIINWKVHLRSMKHKQNAQQAGKSPVVLHENLTFHQGAWPSRRQEVESQQPSANPGPVVLQARRKSVHGTYLTSLAASFSAGDSQTPRPYQRRKSHGAGAITHVDRLRILAQEQVLYNVDFTAEELAIIKGAIIRNGNGQIDISRSLSKVYSDPDSTITRRNKQAVTDQMQSLNDHVDQEATRTFTLIESCTKDPSFRPTRCVGSLLRHRELGSSGIRSELKNRMLEDIRPWRSFKGASHDVVAVAWAPNALHFAAGAVTHSNSEDLQYNRPCNLLFGDLLNNTVKELPDHRVDRQMPQTGRNATNEDLFNACDPKVYKTVTSIKFHPQGNRMYTASEDETVKIWDLSELAPRCVRTLQHDANVTSLDISYHQPEIFATASKKIRNAVRVFGVAGEQETLTMFSSSRAELKQEWKMYPECLHWGPTRHTSHLLLGGFQEYRREIASESEGHLCLWDANTAQDLKVMPASQAIHTAVWHPTLPYFASGGAPGFEKTDRQKTKTVVRTWDLRHTKRVSSEYECRSREMTDVTFSPLDPYIVTAGCTDSRSYVWDWRWPQEPLHKLSHGKSIMPHGENDTGVMMSLWGPGASLYYTGSSDGSIRAWDIRRHPNDVLVHTVAQLGAGIQSGAFSPDGTHLLVGDATGGIHVLSSAPWEPQPSENTGDDTRIKSVSINIIRAPDGSGKNIANDDDVGTEGIKVGQHLLATGQLTVDPLYGPGKGPNYDGPYAMHAREEKPGTLVGRLKKEIYKQQPVSREGSPRPEYADPVRKLAAARKELLDGKKGHHLEATPKASDTLEVPCPTVKKSIHHTPRSKTEKENSVNDDLIPESEMVEENDWWPQLGEKEIIKARADLKDGATGRY